jgi:hypothetical protein
MMKVLAAQKKHRDYFDALGDSCAPSSPSHAHVGSLSCHHGVPHAIKTNPRKAMAVMQPIHFYIKMCEHQEPMLEYDAFEGYWAMNSEALTEISSKALKSMVVPSFLESNYKSIQDARMYAAIATKIDVS